MEKKSLARIIRISLLIVFLGAIAALGAAYYYYQIIFGPSLPKEKEQITLYLKEAPSLEQLADSLSEKAWLKDKANFVWVGQKMKFKGRAGRYILEDTLSSYYQLFAQLRKGQSPVRFTFNNLRLPQQLAGLLGQELAYDSLAYWEAMQKADFMAQNQLHPQTLMTLFIPNTYELYWNISPEEFVDRMKKEHNKFWESNNRLALADSLDLSPAEVYTLASIVDAESNYGPEKARIAGVYLNRLKSKSWKLEADPTVVFAQGDFSIRRVTREMLEIDSPYNTYKYAGLPPGPIRMASRQAIDAVLKAEKHNYWFFCAKPPEEGQPAQHAFARNSAEHGRNARTYQHWLNQQKIYR